MSSSSLRNILMLIAFLGLVVGAILRMKGVGEGIYVLIASIVLYIIPRFLMKK